MSSKLKRSRASSLFTIFIFIIIGFALSSCGNCFSTRSTDTIIQNNSGAAQTYDVCLVDNRNNTKTVTSQDQAMDTVEWESKKVYNRTDINHTCGDRKDIHDYTSVFLTATAQATLKLCNNAEKNKYEIVLQSQSCSQDFTEVVKNCTN